jgi:hypothetical protein
VVVVALVQVPEFLHLSLSDNGATVKVYTPANEFGGKWLNGVPFVRRALDRNLPDFLPVAKFKFVPDRKEFQKPYVPRNGGL